MAHLESGADTNRFAPSVDDATTIIAYPQILLYSQIVNSIDLFRRISGLG